MNPRQQRTSAGGPDRAGRRLAAGLAALLAGSGTLHLARPQVFDPIVPHSMPGPARTWTYLSGVAELGVATALAVPATRPWGGLAAAGLFVAVFPANVTMALDTLRRSRSRRRRVAVLVRLPLQVPLVAAGLRVWRRR